MSSASGRTEYPLLGQNTTVPSNQAIRIYAAASAGHVSADEGIGIKRGTLAREASQQFALCSTETNLVPSCTYCLAATLLWPSFLTQSKLTFSLSLPYCLS
jgi:hypothetical protein